MIKFQRCKSIYFQIQFYFLLFSLLFLEGFILIHFSQFPLFFYCFTFFFFFPIFHLSSQVVFPVFIPNFPKSLFILAFLFPIPGKDWDGFDESGSSDLHSGATVSAGDVRGLLRSPGPLLQVGRFVLWGRCFFLQLFMASLWLTLALISVLNGMEAAIYM